MRFGLDFDLIRVQVGGGGGFPVENEVKGRISDSKAGVDEHSQMCSQHRGSIDPAQA